MVLWQVVKDGKAYCDKTPQLKMQEERAEVVVAEPDAQLRRRCG